MCKVLAVLDEVKACYSVTDGRKQRVAIWSENEISPTVDGTEQVRELK